MPNRPSRPASESKTRSHSSNGGHSVSYTRSSQAGGQRQRLSTMSEFADPQSVYEPDFAWGGLPYEVGSRLDGPILMDMLLPWDLVQTSYPSSTSSSSSSSFSSSSVAAASSSLSHDTYGVMAPSSTQLGNAGHLTWPSPPLASGALDPGYCLQEPSDGLSGVVQPDSSYAPVSPSGWFSSASLICPPALRYHDKKLSTCQAFSTVCSQQLSGDHHGHGCFSSLDGEDKGSTMAFIWGMDMMLPLNPLDSSPMAWSDSMTDSPPPAGEGTPQDTLPTQQQQLVETRSVPWSVSEDASASASRSPPSNLTGSDVAARAPAEGDKTDEPYAKLIYRAFMSRPDHIMTLQEIYQWFRENTSKTMTESRGWQNSIRHNLSMNAAFKKKEKPLLTTVKSVSGSSAEESKRVNEWVLEDWAVHNGVQSTTRYRKTTYARRPPSGRTATTAKTTATNPWAPEHSAKRALSGRKGGCATRASRQRMRTCHRQGRRLDEATSRHSFKLERASPDVFSRCGPVVQAAAQPQPLALHQPYHDGLARGGCGDDTTSEPRHLGLPALNFPPPQLLTNTGGSNSMCHGSHTVGTYHETTAPSSSMDASSLDVRFGTDHGITPCARYREALLACTSSSSVSSSSPSPHILSRSFGVSDGVTSPWRHGSQYH